MRDSSDTRVTRTGASVERWHMNLGLGLTLGRIGSSGFNLSSLANKVARYKVSAAGHNAAWPDLFGLQADFVQAVGGSRPTYVSSVAAMNNKPALQFTGATPTFMTSADSAGWDFTGGYDIWMAMMLTSVGAFNTVISKANEWDSYITAGGVLRSVRNVTPADSSGDARLSTPNTPLIVRLRNAGGNESWWVNGTSLGTAALGAPPGGAVDVHIGKRPDGGTTVTGYLFEILALSAEDTPNVDNLKSYFGAEYGVTMA